MTSGSFQQTPIESITVNRAERQRRQLPDLTELQGSIAKYGLINPITITRELELVAGECRLESCRALGWTSISTQYIDDLSIAERRAIELEENIKRSVLLWQDHSLAVLEYHELRKAEEPAWTVESTGRALGAAINTVEKHIMVAKELRAGNQAVIEAPKYSVARGLVQRSNERKAGAELTLLTAGRTAVPEPVRVDGPIQVADFNEWAPAYTGPKFNFIHCDFPYGIGADKFDQGAAAAHGGYADDEATYWTLIESLCNNLDTLAADQCHLMFWYSMTYHQPTVEMLVCGGWRIDPLPLIWVKSDNVGILPDPSRGPRRIYETCLFGSRGDRKIVRPVSNAFSGPSERDIHMSIKPEPMLGHFFRMFVDETTVMLDPTAGSGGALRAAQAAGARSVVGLERNPDFAERANAKFASAA